MSHDAPRPKTSCPLSSLTDISELGMYRVGAITNVGILEVNRWRHKMKQASLLKCTPILRTFMSPKMVSTATGGSTVDADCSAGRKGKK